MLGTEPRSRKSWVVWQEGGKYPNLIAAVLAQHQAEQERQQKELAQQQIEQETLRAERLAAKLRELNINPDTL